MKSAQQLSYIAPKLLTNYHHAYLTNCSVVEVESGDWGLGVPSSLVRVESDGCWRKLTAVEKLLFWTREINKTVGGGSVLDFLFSGYTLGYAWYSSSIWSFGSLWGSFQQHVSRQRQVNYFFRHLKANYEYLQQLLHLKLSKHFSCLGIYSS